MNVFEDAVKFYGTNKWLENVNHSSKVVRHDVNSTTYFKATIKIGNGIQCEVICSSTDSVQRKNIYKLFDKLKSQLLITEQVLLSLLGLDNDEKTYESKLNTLSQRIFQRAPVYKIIKRESAELVYQVVLGKLVFVVRGALSGVFEALYSLFYDTVLNFFKNENSGVSFPPSVISVRLLEEEKNANGENIPQPAANDDVDQMCSQVEEKFNSLQFFEIEGYTGDVCAYLARIVNQTIKIYQSNSVERKKWVETLVRSLGGILEELYYSDFIKLKEFEFFLQKIAKKILMTQENRIDLGKLRAYVDAYILSHRNNKNNKDAIQATQQ